MLKERLLQIRRDMEGRYLRTFNEKLLYWECRYLLFIVNPSKITVYKLFDLTTHTVREDPDTSYISFRSNFVGQQLDEREQEEIFRILRNIIDDYTKSESQYERNKYLEIIAQYMKYLSLIKNKEEIINDLLGLKNILTENLKIQYSIQSYLYLAKLNYYISDFLPEKQRKQFLEESCEIWERFVFDSSRIPSFVDIYIEALQRLEDIFLVENDIDNYIDAVIKECNVSYELLSINVEYALAACREYPDEMRLYRLEMERESLHKPYRDFLQKKYLRHSRQMLSDLMLRISLFHQIEYYQKDLPCKFTVSMVEPTVIEQLLEAYNNLFEELTMDNKEQIEYIQFRLLVIIYYALEMYEMKLDEKSEYDLLKPNIFYENKVGLIRLLLSLSNGEIMKIQLKYALASTLYEKTSYADKWKIECYREADNLLLQLESEVDETEVITADLYNEEITLYKISKLHCKVLYESACSYFEKNAYDQAYMLFSRAIMISLNSYGMVENAMELDQLLLFIAKKSCEMALECEKLLERKSSSYLYETQKVLNNI